jgi:glycosyltransferase involved in cell wall biosynthesis
MNVLFITPYLPYPPLSGGRLQTFLRLKHLKKRGHSVFLMTLALQEEESRILELKDHLDDLGYIYATPDYGKARYLLRRSLLYEIFTYNRRFSERLRNFAHQNKADIAVFEGLGIAQYRSAIPGVPSVLSEHNVEYEIIGQLVSALRESPAGIMRGPADETLKNIYLYLCGAREIKLVTTYELASLRKFDLIMTCSERDAAMLGSGGNAAPRITIPWCVEKPPVFNNPAKKDICTLGFVGSMQWEPNRDAVRWFVGEMFPRLRKKDKKVHLVIVGSGMSEEIRNLDNGKDIIVQGDVPDISEVFLDVDVFVAPVRLGSGVNVKVIEAMSYGVPVVTTPKGAEGIGGKDGEHFMVANTPEEFVYTIRDLVMNPDRRKTLGIAAREYISAHHSTDSVMEIFEQALHACRERVRDVRASA